MARDAAVAKSKSAIDWPELMDEWQALGRGIWQEEVSNLLITSAQEHGQVRFLEEGSARAGQRHLFEDAIERHQTE